jgi:hypothetical protein
MTIKQIFDEIANEPGTNAKMDILAKYKDNELLKKVLYLVNSKRVKFYIKQIPEYEATAIQRQIERDIRNKKREIAVLKEANVDYAKQSLQLKEYFSKYNDFTKQTGLIKQSERTRV